MAYNSNKTNKNNSLYKNDELKYDKFKKKKENSHNYIIEYCSNIQK